MKSLHLYALSFILILSSCSEDDPEIKLTEAPLSNAATQVLGTSFTANWEAVNGAKEYIIDVSTDVEFNTMVAGYESKTVSGTSLEVSGLIESQKYFYRVKASNNLGETDFSKIIPVRDINKNLLYNILWKGDETKSNLTIILQDLTFSSNNDFTGSLGSFVLATGTWQWKNNTNVMSVESSSGSYELTWIHVEETYCAAYASAITTNLIFYNK